MCGIVGAIAERNITPILVEGLKRLEYRGYDSAGVAVIDNSGMLDRRRRAGKVSSLEQAIEFESRGVYVAQSTEDKVEKQKAFFEKRAPNFSFK